MIHLLRTLLIDMGSQKFNRMLPLRDREAMTRKALSLLLGNFSILCLLIGSIESLNPLLRFNPNRKAYTTTAKE